MKYFYHWLTKDNPDTDIASMKALLVTTVIGGIIWLLFF